MVLMLVRSIPIELGSTGGGGGGLLGKVRDLVTSSPFACLHWAHVQAEFGLSLVILTWEFPVSDMSGLIKNC